MKVVSYMCDICREKYPTADCLKKMVIRMNDIYTNPMPLIQTIDICADCTKKLFGEDLVNTWINGGDII